MDQDRIMITLGGRFILVLLFLFPFSILTYLFNCHAYAYLEEKELNNLKGVFYQYVISV